MNKLFIILGMFCLVSVCRAEQPKDTIDNWQIYLNDSLVAAGYQNMTVLPEILLNKAILKNKLRIVYNRDVEKRTTREIQIGDESRTRFTQKYFGWRQSMVIKVKDLLPSDGKTLILYFYDGLITMPGGKTRGVPLVKIKRV
jgi:hypothetical protein